MAVLTEAHMGRPGLTQSAVRVTLLDLASIVPYYVGHLASALKQYDDSVRVEVASINYHLDRNYFTSAGIQRQPGLADIAGKAAADYPAVRRTLKSLEYLLNLSRTLGHYRRQRQDIVHVQFMPLIRTGFPFERWFLQKLKKSGAKVVYTVHNVLPQDTGDRFRTHYARMYGIADHLICHDDAARQRLVAEFNLPKSRISVIPHGPLFEGPRASGSDVRRRLSIPRDHAIVLWQGILRPYKGVDFLLEAWQQLQTRNAAATLVIAGSGDSPELDKIRARVAALGVTSSVRLDLRFMPLQDVADYHAAADILVYPYREITTSGALMTGVAWGKAVVASRLPAFEQVLSHGENALLVHYGDNSHLGDCLFSLIDNSVLRNRLGAAARKLISANSWPTIAAATISTYQSLLPHKLSVPLAQTASH
jgi:glycosyltransferase involved in cell wall biosynthesis